MNAPSLNETPVWMYILTDSVPHVCFVNVVSIEGVWSHEGYRPPCIGINVVDKPSRQIIPVFNELIKSDGVRNYSNFPFTSGPEDAESFHLEVRSFLSELNCPHPSLVQDLTALSQPGNRLLFIGQL